MYPCFHIQISIRLFFFLKKSDRRNDSFTANNKDLSHKEVKFLYISFILFRKNITENIKATRLVGWDSLEYVIADELTTQGLICVVLHAPPLWVVLDVSYLVPHYFGKSSRIVIINRNNWLMWAEICGRSWRSHLCYLFAVLVENIHCSQT